MIYRFHSRLPGLWREENAAQIVEFAVALPLLVVFVVGIFDFSTAFTFKQRLTNMARDAAHVAATDPSTDVFQGTSVTPISVSDVFQIVDNYLLVNNVNDCGLAATTPTPPTGLTWTFTATANGCPAAGLTLVVNRGYFFPDSGGTLPTDCVHPTASAGGTNVIATCVSIQYPYPWKFGRTASLLGFSDTLPAQITAIGVAMNEN